MPGISRSQSAGADEEEAAFQAQAEDVNSAIISDTEKLKKTNAAYWKRPQIIAIVDWLSEPLNYEGYSTRPGGLTMAQVQTEIADYLNASLGLNLTYKAINSSIQYMRSKYQEAKRLMLATGSGHTGRQSLREQILEHCPQFEALDKVFRTSLVHNAPAPHQTSTPYTVPDDPSDLEDGDNNGISGKHRHLFLFTKASW